MPSGRARGASIQRWAKLSIYHTEFWVDPSAKALRLAGAG